MYPTLRSLLILSVFLWATKSSRPMIKTIAWNTLSSSRCKCTSVMESSGTATIKRMLQLWKYTQNIVLISVPCVVLYLTLVCIFDLAALLLFTCYDNLSTKVCNLLWSLTAKLRCVIDWIRQLRLGKQVRGMVTASNINTNKMEENRIPPILAVAVNIRIPVNIFCNISYCLKVSNSSCKHWHTTANRHAR